MATLNVVFLEKSRDAPVYAGGFLAFEDVGTSGTNAQSAAAPVACIARCKASGGDMYVISGSEAADATSGGMLLADGDIVDLAVITGWVVAVIDA